MSPLSSAGSVEELRQLSRGARGGSDPLVVMAAHGPHTSPAELAELTDLVERLTFVAPR